MRNSVVRLDVCSLSSYTRFVDSVAADDYSSPPNFLLTHPYIYFTIILGLFLVQSIVLILMGQPCLPSTGLDFWYGETSGIGNSQHISDWYTSTHILHGFLFYLLTYGLGLWMPALTVDYRYLMALSAAVIWEIAENTPYIINRYRETAIAAGYNGDSVINSFCDSVACSLGFWMTYFLPWWVILLMAIVEEIILGVAIRDNLILSMIQIVFHSDSISNWQTEKVNN